MLSPKVHRLVDPALSGRTDAGSNAVFDSGEDLTVEGNARFFQRSGHSAGILRRDRAVRVAAPEIGGRIGGEHFSLEDKDLADRVLMIGCGEKDIAWNFREIGVPPTIEALKAKGLPFIPYFVPGGHDWYCWPQMFTEFAENVLWKDSL